MNKVEVLLLSSRHLHWKIICFFLSSSLPSFLFYKPSSCLFQSLNVSFLEGIPCNTL